MQGRSWIATLWIAMPGLLVWFGRAKLVDMTAMLAYTSLIHTHISTSWSIGSGMLSRAPKFSERGGIMIPAVVLNLSCTTRVCKERSSRPTQKIYQFVSRTISSRPLIVGKWAFPHRLHNLKGRFRAHLFNHTKRSFNDWFVNELA